MIKTLWYMRHGQTEYNIRGIWQGQVDSPLSQTGIRQARAAYAYLSQSGILGKVDHVYCSNLGRTQETARIALFPKGDRAIVKNDLAEMSFGDLDGKRIAGDPGSYDLSYFAGIGGESPEGAQMRIACILERIALQSSCRNIFVVGHGTVGQLFYQRWKETSLLKSDGSMDNCGIATYTFDTVKRIFTCIDIVEPRTDFSSALCLVD